MDATKKILIAEDDPFLSSLLKNRFTREGFEVYAAKDGDEAFTMIQSARPDLVLLDIILPKRSGFEVMAQIRESPELEKTPIIIISNLGQPEDVERGQQLGAIEYFIKAKASIDDLVQKIREFLISGGK